MLGRTHALNYLRSLEKGTKVCPQRIQSEQGYKLSLRKNTEDKPLKSERKHNSLTSYYWEARFMLPIMNVVRRVHDLSRRFRPTR